MKRLTSDNKMLGYELMKAYPNISCFSTTRHGGCSKGNYASFNCNGYCGDEAEDVNRNRELLRSLLPGESVELVIPHQTHSDHVKVVDTIQVNTELEGVDALVTDIPGYCLCVSTADCVPVLLYDTRKKVVAAIHAGWRGTVARIVEKTVSVMDNQYGSQGKDLIACIGPSISLEAFEVGDEERSIKINMEIKVSEEIKKACPQFAGIAIRATVENTAYSESLWKKIDEFTICYREMYTTDSIKDMVTIHATREAYKKCGKDPSRYRPSGEALCRRILRGISLYQIDTLVDLINLVSIRYGYSIGGFDADKIQGDTLVLGIGKSGEPYEGIGRGELNIEGMPVYRDAMGGIGTPTSDNERTKLEAGTTHLLTIINGYSGKEGLQEAADYMLELLKEFAASKDEELIYF